MSGESQDEGPIDWHGFMQMAPEVVTTLRALTKVIADAGLEKPLMELLKVRASQLNGCAFCLALHVDFARKAGVAQRSLDLVATWREAGIFSAREQAALAWTEALTLMAQQRPSDEAYEALCREFSRQEIAFLTSSVALINAWNRIAGGLRFAPASVS
ncbi:MAG TPA: carboxymuconolactone decarboxylase family protein [Steroidobacteraceae bacterium]|nr:carboxymuconolactone decarboxylase family protein [Steroidobacteraceae bacterium]